MDCHSEEQDIDGSWQLPAWMTHGRTVLCQKDPRKGNTVENYCPITYLPLMWKLFAKIAKKAHQFIYCLDRLQESI